MSRNKLVKRLRYFGILTFKFFYINYIRKVDFLSRKMQCMVKYDVSIQFCNIPNYGRFSLYDYDRLLGCKLF